MAGQLQLRRGTTIENDALVGAPGEVTVDTTLHQLRLHDGETQGGFVVGNGSGATLLDWKFTDHQLSDISWLRADTFSWQSGSVYQLVYQHLSEDYTEVEEHSETETIAGVTIEYYQAVDGHKIVLADQENNVESIYNATGVAWYYILDAEHQRFKLPRTKHNVVGLRDKIGGYVEPGIPNLNDVLDGVHHRSLYNTPTVGGTGLFRLSDYANCGFAGGGGIANDAARLTMNAHNQNPIYGNSNTVQPPAVQMYLYFFVGNFTQTAVENTAGLNAELFNGKVDTGHQVIAFQAPTAENNYTWYRKYADGWVEQGGIAKTEATNNQWSGISVTFPKQMANNMYTATGTAYGLDSISTLIVCIGGINSNNTDNGTGKTQNGLFIQTEILNPSSLSRVRWINWQVSGMAAN